MEIQTKNIDFFEGYSNRQVVLNYYNEEDYLWKRDGFHFYSLQILNDQLIFLKKDGKFLTISLSYYENIVRNNDFQNYFLLWKDMERLEIYFP